MARAHHLVGTDAADRLAALHATEFRSGGQPKGDRPPWVKCAGTVRLVQRIAEHRTPMSPRHRRDRVAIALEGLSRLEFHEDQLKADPSRDAECGDEQLPQSRRSVDRKRTVTRAQVECLQQPWQSEPVVGVEVRDEDLVEVHETDRADELALGALAAVEQDPVSAAPHEHRGQTAARGRNRAGRAGEEQREVHPDLSLSVEPDELKGDLGAGHTRDSHRVVRCSAPLGRAARVEDLKAIRGALVQRNVGMTKDDRIGLADRRFRRSARPLAGPASWTTPIWVCSARTSSASGAPRARRSHRRCRGRR